jgi:hypothetical protein
MSMIEDDLFALYRYLAGSGCLMLRELDAKDAVLEPCLHLFRVNHVGKLQRPFEFAKASFVPMQSRFVNRRRFAFTLQSKLIARGNENLDIGWRHARQLSFNDQTIRLFPHIQSRVSWRERTQGSAAVQAFEQIVYLRRQILKLAPERPGPLTTTKCLTHCIPPIKIRNQNSRWNLGLPRGEYIFACPNYMQSKGRAKSLPPLSLWAQVIKN